MTGAWHGGAVKLQGNRRQEIPVWLIQAIYCYLKEVLYRQNTKIIKQQTVQPILETSEVLWSVN